MGKHEDAVLNAAKMKELAEVVEATKELQAQVDKADQERGERSELLFSIGQEELRIAGLLANADWSCAELLEYPVPKKHWWSRQRKLELASYLLGDLDAERRHPDGRRAYMRSDDLLYFEERHQEDRDSLTLEDWYTVTVINRSRPSEWTGPNSELRSFLELLRGFRL